MIKQNFLKKYTMINPAERFRIIEKINSEEVISECMTGQHQQWWLKKHHPDNDIPKHIYLLGGGTIRELHYNYLTKYGFIDWEDFIDYTRELIKQNIML